MRTHSSGVTETVTLLILVPHRDARLPLLSYSRSLFAAGLYGAWSFPWAVPLALLSRPFSAEELHYSARTLREALTENEKFRTGPAAFSPFPPDCPFNSGAESGVSALFGPALENGIPDSIFPPGAAGTIRYRFSPLVLGAAFTRFPVPEPNAIPPPPSVSFRAAALANMRCRHLPFESAAADSGADSGCAYSFEWKISPLRWLPRAGKKS